MAAPFNSEPLRTFIDSNEFHELDAEGRISALRERDETFAAMADQDPDGAARFVDAVTHMSRGEYTPSMMTSLEGGLERGIGWAAHAAAGLLRIVEDAGIVEDAPDEDILAYANQRIDQGGRRIGSDWHHRLAGLTGSIAAGAVPGVALTSAAYAGGAALGATGVPLLVAAEGLGFGTAGFLQGLGESEGDYEHAARRGAVDTVLGGLGGWSSTMRRAFRVPMDFTAAATAQATVLGMPLDQALTQAGVISILAGVPGKRIAPAKLRALDPNIEQQPYGAAIMADAELAAQGREAWIANANRKLPEPMQSRDGVPYDNLADFWQAEGKAIQDTPVIHWHPQDRTPSMREKWTNREQHAAVDERALEIDNVSAEMASGWNPGWRHVEQVPYGALPDRVVEASGGQVKRPQEIIAPFAKAFGFRPQLGNVRNATLDERGVLGWHWATAREMKVLRRDDVQTLAHEWGHDIVVLEKDLARYVQGKELASDVQRLRNWLQQEEAAAGRSFHEKGVPTAALYRHKDKVPDDLKYIEELAAMSYDRPDLREGFSEFVRVYLTNNKDFGGNTDLSVVAPRLQKIFGDWIEGLDKDRSQALKTFANEAHAYARQDATTSMLAMMGGTSSPQHVMQGAVSRARQRFIDSNEGVYNAIRRAVGPEEADTAMAYMQSAQAASSLTDLSAYSAVPRLVRDKDGNFSQMAGDGDSLQEIIRDIGPTDEFLNAFGAYAAARRSKELLNRTKIGGQRRRVDQAVDEYIARLKKRVTKAGPRAKAEDLQTLRFWNDPSKKRWQKEDLVLGRMGAKRVEVPFTRDAVDKNLDLPSNPRYSHFPEQFERAKAWQRQVRAYAEESGVIGKKQARELDEWNAEYLFPFQRDMSDVVGGAVAKGAAAREGSVIREATGSLRALSDDWLTLTLQGADTLFRRAEENIAKRFVVDTILNSRDAGIWFSMHEHLGRTRSNPYVQPIEEVIGDVPLMSGPEGHNITVFRDGKRYHYRTLDADLGGETGILASLEHLHPPAHNGIVKLANRVRKFSQDAVTLNPEFFIPALARDLTGSFLFSKTGGSTIKKAISGLHHAYRNTPQYREYIALVGSAGTLTDVKPATRAELVRMARNADSRVRQVITSPRQVIDTLRRITNAIEASTRFGEYQAARRQGIPAKKAAWLGTQVQPHFSARGTNNLFRGVVDSTRFLGATLNSVDRLMRGLFRDTNGRARLVGKLGGLALAAITLDEVNRRLIPDWAEIPAWLKQANLIIPVPVFDAEKGGWQFEDDGRLKMDLHLMPKNHEVGLVANVASRVMDEMYADTRKGVAQAAFDVGAILAGGVGVNVAGDAFPWPSPVLLGDAAEVYFNKNFFTGNPIEGFEMEGVSAWNRTNERTPEMWRQYGQVTKHMPWLPDALESPTMAQHILEQFTATFGAHAAFLSDRLFNPYAMELKRGEYPVMRRFDLVEGKYSNVERQFWDDLGELSKLSNDLKKWEKEGNISEIAEAARDPNWGRDFARAQAMESAQRQLSEISRAMKMNRLAKISPSLKRQNHDRLVQARREVMRRLNQQWGTKP